MMETMMMFIEDLAKLLDLAFNVAVMALSLPWAILRHTKLGQSATGGLRFALDLSVLSVCTASLAEDTVHAFSWFAVLGWAALMWYDDYGL